MRDPTTIHDTLLDLAAHAAAGPRVADLGFARLDLERDARCGFPEVVFAARKTPAEVAAISARLFHESGRLLVTRASPAHADAVAAQVPTAVWHERAGVIVAERLPRARTGAVAVVTAGTADRSVADEAALTADMLGARVATFFDVGVAGLHRVMDIAAELRRARAVVVVAGMEGALASVVGGLVAVPVIAVPTSTGYGASFGGVAALLAMLNACAPNVTVVNIDNGFGAGYSAALINRTGSEEAPR